MELTNRERERLLRETWNEIQTYLSMWRAWNEELTRPKPVGHYTVTECLDGMQSALGFIGNAASKW